VKLIFVDVGMICVQGSYFQHSTLVTFPITVAADSRNLLTTTSSSINQQQQPPTIGEAVSGNLALSRCDKIRRR